MGESFSVKQGVFTAQALLKSLGHDIAVDGAWGPASKRAFVNTSEATRLLLVDVVHKVNRESATLVSSATLPKRPVLSDFDRVVKAMIKESKSRGLPNPMFYVAQVALETGWGRSTPKSASGGKSWNYGGLKSNSVRRMVTESSSNRTTEVINGKSVQVDDKFAVFTGPEHFAKVYFWYVFDGPSSYRYKGVQNAKNAYEFGRILQHNGYATDPQYAAKISSIVSSAERKYASLA